MSKRRKHDELWLLHLANQMIGKLKLSQHTLDSFSLRPHDFLKAVAEIVSGGLSVQMQMMTPETLGCIVSVEIKKDRTGFRQLPFSMV